jgi:hypothetical protein
MPTQTSTPLRFGALGLRLLFARSILRIETGDWKVARTGRLENLPCEGGDEADRAGLHSKSASSRRRLQGYAALVE